MQQKQSKTKLNDQFHTKHKRLAINSIISLFVFLRKLKVFHSTERVILFLCLKTNLLEQEIV